MLPDPAIEISQLGGSCDWWADDSSLEPLGIAVDPDDAAPIQERSRGDPAGYTPPVAAAKKRNKASPRERAFALRMLQIERARNDPNAFIEYVFGNPQEDCHRRWQDLWTEYRRSVLLAPTGSGKTTQLRGRLLWELGCDPDERFLYLSSTEDHPKRQVSDMKEQIERNQRVRHVFPNLKRGRDWQALRFTVQRSLFAPEASVQAYGSFAQGVLGARANGLVIDDLCNFTNTLTHELREKMNSWLGSVLSRLTIPGSKPWVRAIGHIWHKEDQLQRLAKKVGWGYLREEAYSVVDGERILLAPRVLPIEMIEEKILDLGTIQSEMMLFNRLPSEGAGRFREEWFWQALELGRGLPFRPPMWREHATFTGVDLGHKKKAGSDYTAIVTIAVLPNGKRQLLDARRGRWTGPEILRELRAVERAYGSVIAVEDNGAQQHLIDFAKELTTMPIEGTHTGVSKWHLSRGVEGWAIELSRGQWLFPCDKGAVIDNERGVLTAVQPAREIQELKNEAMAFDPSKPKEHTGDLLMALWIARKAIEMFSIPSMGEEGIPTDPIDFLTR